MKNRTPSALDQLNAARRLTNSPLIAKRVPSTIGGLSSVHKVKATPTSKSSSVASTKKHATRDHNDPRSAFIRDTDSGDTPVFHTEPDWSGPSDDDEYNPAGGLPHAQRWNISRRRANAFFTLALEPTEEERQRKIEGQARQQRRAARLAILE